MATRHFNITGASSAAAELTRELLAPGDNAIVSSISIANVEGSNACTVDLYIEKVEFGKFYFFKQLNLPADTAFTHPISFRNTEGEFGLYIKLTKTASEVPAVDVIIT
jgi:hypothetical protein